MGKILGSIVKVGFNIIGGPKKRRMDKALEKPFETSAATLRGILKYAQDTDFGREHNFSRILEAENDNKLIELYRECVPANDYEDIRPYVERHLQGKESALVPGKPFMYATTSGTTAQPKLLPMSLKYKNDVFKTISTLWYWTLSRDPRTVGGHILAIVGPAVEGFTEDGTPMGSISGYTQATANAILRKRLAIPDYITDIHDYTARYYTMMRIIVEMKDLSVLVTANPSTVLELLKNGDEYFGEYINDIEHGTLSSKFDIPDDIREKLCKRFKPNRKRAAELREIKKKYGRPLPKYIWPNFATLSTWRCGNTPIFINRFINDFPEKMHYYEIGYFSSECRFGLTFDESLWTVPMAHLHFFEFVEESEIGSENPHFLLVNELEEGKNYCAFITTCSGLYRYNMNDLIVAGPKYKNTPTVHMVQKINGIVSITGEKLYERQFIDAVHEAEKEQGVKSRFFVAFADVKEQKYNFYFEFEKKTDQDTTDAFSQKIDATLQNSNIEYAAKRQSGRLKEPSGFRLIGDSFRNFKRECLKRGMRDGQFKLVHLMQDEKREEIFKRLIHDDSMPYEEFVENIHSDEHTDDNNNRRDKRKQRREQNKAQRIQRREQSKQSLNEVKEEIKNKVLKKINKQK